MNIRNIECSVESLQSIKFYCKLFQDYNYCVVCTQKSNLIYVICTIIIILVLYKNNINILLLLLFYCV